MPFLPRLQTLIRVQDCLGSSRTRLRIDIVRKGPGTAKPDLSASHCNFVHTGRSLGPAMQASIHVSTFTKVADRCCMFGYRLRRLCRGLRKATTRTTCQHHPSVSAKSTTQCLGDIAPISSLFLMSILTCSAEPIINSSIRYPRPPCLLSLETRYICMLRLQCIAPPGHVRLSSRRPRTHMMCATYRSRQLDMLSSCRIVPA